MNQLMRIIIILTMIWLAYSANIGEFSKFERLIIFSIYVILLSILTILHDFGGKKN